jgi:hypothetical protein
MPAPPIWPRPDLRGQAGHAERVHPAFIDCRGRDYAAPLQLETAEFYSQAVGCS